MFDPDMFGAPRTGVHAYRVFDVAIVDVIGTIIACLLIHKIFNISLLKTMIYAFGLGIALHRAFGVRTKIDTVLFGK